MIYLPEFGHAYYLTCLWWLWLAHVLSMISLLHIWIMVPSDVLAVDVAEGPYQLEPSKNREHGTLNEDCKQNCPCQQSFDSSPAPGLLSIPLKMWRPGSYCKLNFVMSVMELRFVYFLNLHGNYRPTPDGVNGRQRYLKIAIDWRTFSSGHVGRFIWIKKVCILSVK